MNGKKALSIGIDVLLGGVSLFLAYCFVSMMISTTKPENYGAPMLFNRTLLCVVTDSMAEDRSTEVTPEQKEEEDRVGSSYAIGHIEPGEGIIIEKRPYEEISVGDVITFYYDSLGALDTHRVMEIDPPSELNGNVFVFHTRGDNLHSQFGNWDVSTRDDPVKQDQVLGVVTSQSAFLGGVLKFVSPSVPDGYAAWFVPLLILVPISAIAASTIVQAVKESKAEKAELDAEIAAAMEKDGKDPTDEASRLLYEEKIAYKRELRLEMEKAKARERKRLSKKGQTRQDALRVEIEKEKARLRAEASKQGGFDHENQE